MATEQVETACDRQVNLFDRSALPSVLSLRGWFQIGWSADYTGNHATALRYFARDLVAYRDAEGEVLVFDAYCPHLGAHLGFGGLVANDGLVCPFHGWKWDSDGANVDIPYSEKVKRNRAKRLNKWHVAEADGLVFLWHDPNGGPPLWPAPKPLEEGVRYYPLYPEGVKAWDGVTAHPQLALENAADGAHFKWVHGSSQVARCVGYGGDGPEFTTQYELQMGRPDRKTWIADEGGLIATLVTRAWGVGVLNARFSGADGAVNMLNMTPIDETTSRLMSSNWVPRVPDTGRDDEMPDVVRTRIREQFIQAERDLVIWEHQAYVPKAPFPPEESAAFVALRAWSEQFYVPAVS